MAWTELAQLAQCRGKIQEGKDNTNCTYITVMTLCFRTHGSGHTVQTQIRLLLEEQSDQGLHCLLFNLHLFDEVPKRAGLFSLILGSLQQSFLMSQNLGTLRYTQSDQHDSCLLHR